MSSSNHSDSPDAKKPCKGILKSSSSFDRHQLPTSSIIANHRKSAKFDELNVLQTFHPPDKDYGHMKVDEPNTPFNFVDPADVDELDAELLAEKLKAAAERRSSAELAGGFDGGDDDDDEDDDDSELTETQKQHKKEFQNRRKAHYNEFEAVRLARKLIEEEDEDDDDDDDDDGGKDKSKPLTTQTMDVEETSVSPKVISDAGVASSSAK